MENGPETPMRVPIQSETTVFDCKTPLEDREIDKKSQSLSSKTSTTTPDPLKVPKAFNKYPERYRSPTDLMMSPITKGLLARNRKGGALLPPSINRPTVQDVQEQEVVFFEV